MKLFFTVAERGVQIPVTREQLLYYAGPSQVIASALVFKLFCTALEQLSPAFIPERTDITVLTAFPGAGVVDCIEYITRARTSDDGRLAIDTSAGPDQAPAAFGGRFYFEVAISEHRRGYWPRQGIFDKTFVDMVSRYQEGNGSPEEETAYQLYKQNLTGRLLGSSGAELFHSRVVCSGSQAVPLADST